MSAPPPLGGFFGLEVPETGAGLWRHWQADRGIAYVNASSALSALISARAPGQVWFPAFVCPEFPEAAPEAARRYYALSDDLSPDTATLSPMAGDMVVAVNYFGRAPGAAWAEFAAARPEVTFVEDCAQTVCTGAPAWGHWRLYSPRKLVGVPDGGLLVPTGSQTLPCAPEEPPLAALQGALAPKLARMERPMENALWHPMNQAQEAAHAVTCRGMSALSRRLLGLVDVERLSARRRENFGILAESLGDWAVITDPDPAFVPFGFPVRLPAGQRDRVAQRLYAQNIFPAVHWRHLPVSRDFARDWARADTYLTLPCDQRWEAGDMDRLSRAFRAALTP
ncbi:MAG: hypothetical protein AAF968_02630 [Pseudomonadota bacterium]